MRFFTQTHLVIWRYGTATPVFGRLSETFLALRALRVHRVLRGQQAHRVLRATLEHRVLRALKALRAHRVLREHKGRRVHLVELHSSTSLTEVPTQLATQVADI